MKYINWIIIICIILSAQCQEKRKSHRVIQVYKHGNIFKEYLVNNKNQKDGFYKEFYANGRMKVWYSYANNVSVGEQKIFFETGILQARGYYINGKLDSIQKWYYSNGKLKSEAFRLEGKLFGVQKEYDSIGRLRDLYFMKNDSNMLSSLDVDGNGKIINKTSNIIYNIYDKNILQKSDTLGAIFYTYFPPGYQCECELIERKQGGDSKRVKCDLIEINNNKAILVQRNFKDTGHYEIGVFIKIENKSFQSAYSDSLFLSLQIF